MSYLTIITTVLVVTQIIRVVQNHISLKRQEEDVQRNIQWINDREIKAEDFYIQREVFRMLYKKLEREEDMLNEQVDEFLDGLFEERSEK